MKTLFIFIFIFFISNSNQSIGTIIEIPEIIQKDTVHDYYIHVYNMSQKYGVSFNIVSSVIYVESNFNQFAVNKNSNGTYDLGIAQINNKYIKYYENRYNMDIDYFNPYQSIEFASKHLSYLINRFGLYNGICAYNCGETAVKNNKIPESTRKYAEKVLSLSSVHSH